MRPQYSPRLHRRPKIQNEIRRYRLRLGLTQREVAKRIGVRLSTFSAWERGVTWPAKDRMLDVAIALSTLVEGLYPEFFFVKKRRLLTDAKP
jgi:transcriptional regulator with XRE-family HTH domain